MSWWPCLAARSRGVFLFLSLGSSSTVLYNMLLTTSFLTFRPTLAQSSLTAARLPEMQARCRGEEPKLSALEKIVKTRGFVLPGFTWFLRVEPGVDEHLHQSWEAFIGGPVQGGVSVDVGEVRSRLFPQQKCGHHGATEHAGHHQRGQALVVHSVHGDPRREENVNHRHVAIATGPVDGAGPLPVVRVVVHIASVLDEEPAGEK